MNTSPTDKRLQSVPAETLWKSFQAGSHEAYAIIYQQHFFYLLDYGKKITKNREIIKDAIQDLFIELWNNRLNLATVVSVKGYLATALRYKLYQKIGVPSSVSIDISDQMWVTSQEDIYIEKEISAEKKKKIHHALLQLLTTRQQEAVRLKFYEGLNNEEIATSMQISKEAVYNTVSKALKVLRGNIDKAALAIALLLDKI